jgi:hypothetical protein
MSLQAPGRFTIILASLWFAAAALAQQQVCLPAPRLLTMMPMGGQAGSRCEATIAGENLDVPGELLFSTPKITAKPKIGADGKAEVNKFVIEIAADAARGVYDARVMTRLGISSARAFSVGALPEVTRKSANTTLATAMELQPNCICNAATSTRAIDFYAFQAAKGKRMAVDCAATGIDSKLNPVVIIGDAAGHELLIDRAGGALDFTPPADGKYFIKVHDLTFQGGAEYFYRLALVEALGDGPVRRQPSTMAVNAFSLPPDAECCSKAIAEKEPNNLAGEAQKITLPCEVDGSFFPAGDVDTFEFQAKKSEVWWVEVISERLGLATNPFVLVQRVTKEGSREKLADVVEMNGIASPVKVSSNGYAYDGPPYNAGSMDALGKLEIPEDGLYRLQLRDLFGGTRSDPRNIYKLIIRKAAPDYSLVAWAMHMELRNGDRNALSKPIALRGGSTMALEVVAARKDGFDGEIDLNMEDLPPGVSACGLKIPAGKAQGMMLITAAEEAPRSLAMAKLVGRAQINGVTVSHPCHLASMTWPVKDAMAEVPNPRLLADMPVSVGGSELAPVTITAREDKVWEAKAGDKLTIPLKLTWRGEFSGSFKLVPLFGGPERSKKGAEAPIKAPTMDAVVDLAALNTPPGEYTMAFCGSYVAKYRANLDGLKLAEEEQKKADEEATAAETAAKMLTEAANAAPSDRKTEADSAAKEATARRTAADAAKAEAAKRMKAATDLAAPKETVDIVVSEPIRIRVKPVDSK